MATPSSSSPLIIRLIIVEGKDFPNINDPSLGSPFAYAKIKWNGQKYKTEIDKIHKWNKEFVLLWKPDQDPSILHIEVWTSYPGVNGRHTALGSIPIDLGSLQLNAKSRALYGLMRARSCPGFGTSNPALKIQIQLLDANAAASPSPQSPRLVQPNRLPSAAEPSKAIAAKPISRKYQQGKQSEARRESKTELVKRMEHDNPSASREDIELALSRANYDLDEALQELAAIMVEKFTGATPQSNNGQSMSEDGSSDSSDCDSLILTSSVDEDEYEEMRKGAEVGERGALNWFKQKRREMKKKRGEPSNRFDNRRVLNAANEEARKRREEKRHRPPVSPIKQSQFGHQFGHQVAGTRRMLSIPVEDRLKELLPFCSGDQIRKALKKYNDNADQALDELLDTRIEQVGQTVIAQQLSTTGVLAQKPEDMGKTFLNFAPHAHEDVMSPPHPLEVPVAPMVSDSPDDYVSDNGKRKALLIGINYIGSTKELKGCIEDTKHMRKLLTTVYGFPDNDGAITVLTDDSTNPYLQPTKKNILAAFQWLVSDAEPGSSLFFHFSGHGGQKWNKAGTEQDGFDETIMPVDYKKKGHIIDDEIFKELVHPLKRGAKLTCLMDCCHSGSAMDLPFIWNAEKRKWDVEFKPKYAAGDVQLFAGCADEETSADFYIPQQESGGAMTKALRHSLAANPFDHTYPSLMESIRKFLRSWGFQQTPQLSSSKDFTFDKKKFGITNTNPVIGNQNPIYSANQRASQKPKPQQYSPQQHSPLHPTPIMQAPNPYYQYGQPQQQPGINHQYPPMHYPVRPQYHPQQQYPQSRYPAYPPYHQN